MITIIDGNNLAYRALYKFGQFTNRRNESTAIVYGGPYMIGAALKKFPPSQIYVAFDACRAKERIELLEGYKDRDKKIGFDRDDFSRQMNLFMDILVHLGVHVVYEAGEEADDLIYRIWKKFKTTAKTIISGDKDFVPLLNNYTKIYNPAKDKLITKLNVKEIYGFEAGEFVDYLVLKGDKSDHIPGVYGLGDVRIRELLDEFGSIDELFEADDRANVSETWRKYLPEIKQAYDINFPLINLRYFHSKYRKHKKGIPLWKEPVWDVPYVQQIARLNAITTFLKPEFLKPFKRLEDARNMV